MPFFPEKAVEKEEEKGKESKQKGTVPVAVAGDPVDEMIVVFGNEASRKGEHGKDPSCPRQNPGQDFPESFRKKAGKKRDDKIKVREKEPFRPHAGKPGKMGKGQEKKEEKSRRKQFSGE